MPRDRTTGRFVTAKRTTTVTESLTIHHDNDDTLAWAPGWDTQTLTQRQAHREQRAEQVWRAAEIIVAAADPSVDLAPLRPLDPETLRQAVVILRAGPGASPMELAFGRSI